MILIDTSVWSVALRRRPRDLNPLENTARYTWSSLVVDGEAVIIGPVRQEVLSGLQTRSQFQTLKNQLDVIPDLALTNETWEQAAVFYNACRANGIAPETVDMTICAAAHAHGLRIFSLDPDFARYAKHLPIRLFRV